LTNFTLVPKIESMKFNEIDASQSTIGDVDTDGIKEFLNLGVRLALPILNKVLSKGFEIPHTFNNTISIENATFASF